jgi:glycosyltransferase involved in cell wall biosynthesis
MLGFGDLRIGYAPASASLDAPGDRRRFCYYAKKRGIRYEIAKPEETYDVVVISNGADISEWTGYAGERTKIIFDFPDAYLAIPPLDPMGLLRGLAKFVVRQNRRLLLNYTRGLEEICKRADAVVCTTSEEQERIQSLCGSVHAILDFQGNDVRTHKADYSAGEVFHVVWEGLPGSITFLNEIRDVLYEVKRKRKIALHIVTALRYGKYLHGVVGKRRTEDEARKIFQPVYVYAWNEQTISAICAACDLAVIPIALENALYAGKPENKLLFFWRLGVPAIVSATAAHVRAMQQSGLAMACNTTQDWRVTLEEYISDEDARREAGQKGKAFVEQHHSEEKMLAQWDEVFRSVLGQSIEPQELNSRSIPEGHSVESIVT